MDNGIGSTVLCRRHSSPPDIRGQSSSIHSALDHFGRMRNNTRSKQYQLIQPSKAGVYDFSELARTQYSHPILTGRSNGFPQRIGTANSEKLRQMYYKTDRLSGRLAFNTAYKQAAHKRLSALLEVLDMGDDYEDAGSGVITPDNSEADEDELTERQGFKSPPVIPPIQSARGLTIYREYRASPSVTPRSLASSLDDKTGPHAQLSVYLPRADILNSDKSSANQNSSSNKQTENSKSKRPASSKRMTLGHQHGTARDKDNIFSPWKLDLCEPRHPETTNGEERTTLARRENLNGPKHASDINNTTSLNEQGSNIVPTSSRSEKSYQSTTSMADKHSGRTYDRSEVIRAAINNLTLHGMDNLSPVKRPLLKRPTTAKW